MTDLPFYIYVYIWHLAIWVKKAYSATQYLCSEPQTVNLEQMYRFLPLNRLLVNRLIVICHDIALIPIAWFGAYWLRFNLEQIPHESIVQGLSIVPYAISLQTLSYVVIGSYRSMWGFASLHDLTKVIKAVLLGGLLLLLTVHLINKLHGLPRSIIPLYMILLTGMLSTSRFALRLIRDLLIQQQAPDTQRVLIIGAGSAGEGLVRDMLRTNTYKPIALVDDKASKQGQEIHGIRVVGRCKDIPQIVEKYRIESIIFAIPSASGSRLRRIMNTCDKLQLPVHTLPALQQIVAGQVSVDLLRKISLDDLLGREPVSLDWSSINAAIFNKTILISGAGGSIGAEVCRQVSALQPKKLIAIEHSEFNLFNLEQDLLAKFPHLELHKYLVDVRDAVAVDQIFSRHQPEIIFHAAAYKHVPMLQSQIREAIANNILGTQILAQAAIKYHTQQFILVSTDKAVNPENIMGASKRAAEIICQTLNDQGNTRFTTVRFGNVLGSAGSVVPIFKQQIDNGGPVTVTHPDITRYFMTIPEAAQLILQAMAIGKGGEIFVLDMGEPIKISSLAEHMICLAGKRVGVDIEIKYTDLRPGEKLYEELFYDKEELEPTDHVKILRALPRKYDWLQLSAALENLQTACNSYDIPKLGELLKKLVPEMA
jgi:FlaA1/EpsC-like NDP-sugar epimerase